MINCHFCTRLGGNPIKLDGRTVWVCNRCFAIMKPQDSSKVRNS